MTTQGPATKPIAFTVLAGFLSFTANAQLPRAEPELGRSVFAAAVPAETAPFAEVSIPADDPTAPAPHFDCAFSGSVDPDGAGHRRSIARGTDLFAASHPLAQASGGESVTDLTVKTVGDGLGPASRRIPRVNYVDDEIFGTMDANHVTSSPLSSDAEFLRRVTLDLTGRIPDAATVTSFLNDPSADKRNRMIDQLLASDEFNDRWALYFDDLFKNTFNADSGKLGVPGRNAFHAYFVDSLRSHKPYDVIARELIAAVGDNTKVGQANFEVRNIQTNGPAQDTYDNLAATVGTAFLGTNAIFCTSCHNGSGHMDLINLWGATKTRQDFWGMSAFFSRVSMPRSGMNLSDYYYTVGDRANGNYALNTTTGNKTVRTACTSQSSTNCWMTDPMGLTEVTPKYVMNAGTPMNNEGYRAAMGRLLTADPQFAKAAVNYIWKELFTLGIVEPADGFDFLRQDPASPPPPGWSIQPTHPNLLVKLAQDFQSSGFDLRSILRTMARSSAYQLSSYYPGTWNDSYAPYFARHYIRRLGSEMMFDAITRATNVTIPMTVNGYISPVNWAVQLPDTSEPQSRNIRAFLDTFLRGDRDQDVRSYQGSISQALDSMNDATTVTNRIKSSASGSTNNKLLASNASAQQMVTTLFVSTLSRLPSASENAAALSLFSGATTVQQRASVAEDLQFALLNKLDFLFKY